MKWLLIFIIMSMDTPIYLEFETQEACMQTGFDMQINFAANTNLKSVAPPYNTFACVEQE